MMPVNDGEVYEEEGWDNPDEIDDDEPAGGDDDDD
jgi:hypothetical protein